MYYMIRRNILFRQHGGFGHITDNSLFGYRKPGDERLFPGERYVSESGAYMLSVLGKTPKSLEDIARQVFVIFKDVDFDQLRSDISDFFNTLVEEGFLSCGETCKECQDMPARPLPKKTNEGQENIGTGAECLNAARENKILLKSLHIELATECNERCVHCYIPHKYKTKKMETALLFHLLDQAKNLNVLNITLSGGEPLLHEDFCVILERLRTLDMSVNVLSNLTLLTNVMIEEMVKNPLLSVQTSIYSMSPGTHDMITGVKGSFDKTLKSLKQLQAMGVPIQVSCPIMRHNKDSFDGVVAFCEQNGLQVSTDYVIFASYDHTGCNLDSRLSLDEVVSAIDRRASDSYMHKMHLLAAEKEQLGVNSPICSVCRYYMCISATGKAYPCVGWQSNEIGDAKHQSIKEIWEASEAVKYLRSIKWEDFPKCTKCVDRGFCTVCMMSNSNENKDASVFKIDDFHCKVASLLHKKVDSYADRKEAFP